MSARAAIDLSTIVLILTASAVFCAPAAAQPLAPPLDSAFIATGCAGANSLDSCTDSTRDHRNVVGVGSDAAAYYASDATYIYLRLRVEDDPRQAAGFRSFGWSWGIDGDGDGLLDAFVLLDGTGMSDDLSIVDQDPGDGTTPTVTFDDVETPGPSYAFATAAGTDVCGGSVTADWFITVAVPRATLDAFGVGSTVAVYVGSSNNGTGINEDAACVGDPVPGDLTMIPVDPIPLGCGDGDIDSGETCDDNNTTSGDGCDSSCIVESGYVCTGAPSDCLLNIGEPCLLGTECESAICNGTTNTCQACNDTTAVGIDAGCTGPAPICLVSAGVATCSVCDDTASGTMLDDGCSALTPVCNVSTGMCEAACATGADCSDGVECTDDLCTLGVCSNPPAIVGTGCGLGDACDGAGACIDCVDDSLGTDSGCPTGAPVCVGVGAASMCVACADTATGVGVDAGCSMAAPICDAGSGTCLECRMNTDCGAGQTCVANACVVDVIPGGTCDDSDDCSDADASCSGGSCLFPLGTGMCMSDSHCIDAATGANCDSSGTCTYQLGEGDCATAGDAGCEGAIECSSTGVCGGNDAGCATNRNTLCVNTCIMDTCAPRSADGAVCDVIGGIADSTDCSGGNCDAASRLCAPSLVCADNADCAAAGDSCIALVCTPQAEPQEACDPGDADDCATTGAVCDAATNTCLLPAGVAGCDDSADCVAALCNVMATVCQVCLDDQSPATAPAVDSGCVTGQACVGDGALAMCASDTDTDGVPDEVDIDDDNDGILDADEGDAGVDTDEDSIPDSLDLDADGDGLADALESGNPDLDSDGDGVPDGCLPVNADGSCQTTVMSGATTDSDGDGVPDFQDTDSDNDTIPDLNEGGAIAPLEMDGDGDGLDDAYDPDAGGTPTVELDTDEDGVPNQEDVDADGDGITDGVECPDFTDCSDSDSDDVPDYLTEDSDGDGIPDIVEGHDENADGVADVFPTGDDTDRDGLDDAYDGDQGGIQATVPDVDEDGLPDFQDPDSDGDLIPDADEYGGGALSGNDHDADGLDDALDPDCMGMPAGCVADNTLTAPPRDTDGDGTPDYLDNDGITDTDDDGVPDALECGITPLPSDLATCPTDTDGDGIPNVRDVDDDNDGIFTVDEGNAMIDTDGDGIDDYLDLDSDGDGITDAVESGNPDPDADGDGIPDGCMPGASSDGACVSSVPMGDLTDSDMDATPDFQDADSDSEGPGDAVEGHDVDGDGIADVAPSGNDADMDGLDDAYDPSEGGTQAPLPDTDGDGTPDFQDATDDRTSLSDGGLSGGACSASDSGSSFPGWWLLLGALVLGRRRQRRR